MKWWKKLFLGNDTKVKSKPYEKWKYKPEEVASFLNELGEKVAIDVGTGTFLRNYITYNLDMIASGKAVIHSVYNTLNDLVKGAALSGFINPVGKGADFMALLRDDSLIKILVYYAEADDESSLDMINAFVEGTLDRKSQAKGTNEAFGIAEDFVRSQAQELKGGEKKPDQEGSSSPTHSEILEVNGAKGDSSLRESDQHSKNLLKDLPEVIQPKLLSLIEKIQNLKPANKPLLMRTIDNFRDGWNVSEANIREGDFEHVCQELFECFCRDGESDYLWFSESDGVVPELKPAMLSVQYGPAVHILGRCNVDTYVLLLHKMIGK